MSQLENRFLRSGYFHKTTVILVINLRNKESGRTASFERFSFFEEIETY